MTLYPAEELYREMAFICYYYHWSQKEVMELDHQCRRRWCEEISKINKSLSPGKKEKEKNIFELRPSGR